MDGGAAHALLPASAPEASGEALPEWAPQAAELLGRTGWTASEIASFRVPGLPATRAGVHKLMQAKRVLVDVEERPGGEAHVYNKYSMPADIRSAIARRLAAHLHVCLPSAPAAREPAAVPAAETVTRSQQRMMAMPPKLALRADARAAIVTAFEAWAGGVGKVGPRAADLFCTAYAAGAVTVPAWVRDVVPSCCGKSLLSWVKIRATEGVAGLAGNYKPRQAALDVSDALATTAEGFLAEHPTASAVQLLQTLEACHPDEALPSLRSVQRWLDAWKRENRQLHLHLVSPDAHRSRFRPAFGDASAGITRVNQLWEMDSTPGDVMLLDGRHTVIGVIDVYSRRKRLLVWPTSSGEGIALLIRRALLEWGVPEVLRTDNGADYTSARIVRLCADLGIHRDVTNPFSPEEKPHIERALGVFSHGLVELLPGYYGNRPVSLTAKRNRLAGNVDLAGAGTAGDIPGYAPLLRACGLAETVAAGTHVDYTPVSSGEDAASLYHYVDGTRQIGLGARGTFNLDIQGGGNPRIRFDMQGLYGAPSAQSLPVPALGAFVEPLPVNQSNTPTSQLNGQNVVLRSFTYAHGNSLTVRDLPNSRAIRITDRQPSATITIEAPDGVSPDFFGQVGNLVPFSLVHGLTAGNIVEVTLGQARLLNPRYSNENNILMLSFDLRPEPTSAGNDEFRLRIR